MESPGKKLKNEKIPLEQLSQWMAKQLESNKTKEFLTRIDLEYNIWCLSLNCHLKYIINLISGYKKLHNSPDRALVGEKVIREEIEKFLNELFAFIIYLAIDSNRNNASEQILSPFELTQSDVTLTKLIMKSIEKFQTEADLHLSEKINALVLLIDMYNDLSFKHKHDLFVHLFTKDENNNSKRCLKALFQHYEHRLSRLASEIEKYKKVNFIQIIEHCNNRTDYDECLLTSLKSHVNSTLGLYCKLENLHRKLHKQPVLYNDLFQMVDMLLKNARHSFEIYECHRNKAELKNIEVYMNVIEMRDFLRRTLSILLSSKKLPIDPYLKLHLLNEDSFEHDISNSSREKLVRDLKAFLHIVKILQYCGLLAFVIDFNRNEIKIEDYERVLKEYCQYSAYLVRSFVLNLIELSLNIRMNYTESIEFIRNFNQGIQLEILNYINNMCTLEEEEPNRHTETAKSLFNFAKMLLRRSDGVLTTRDLTRREITELNGFLGKAAEQLVFLIISINEAVFKNVPVMKLEIAKAKRRDLCALSKSTVELDALRSYLDALILLITKLNQLKRIEMNQLCSSVLIFEELYETLFKCASLLSTACVKTNELLKFK